ncbi:hypothetical protein D9M73_51790 [compost metagenome]|uniref:Uncharacterized protein n=1 Tax=Polaromonas aquatica TaxID=332657 RepID=A0ABW1TW20_9BURK
MPELSPTGFEVLQAAVRIARDKQIKTLQSLREHLGTLFPARGGDIDQAVAYWAAHVQRTGVPS